MEKPVETPSKTYTKKIQRMDMKKSYLRGQLKNLRGVISDLPIKVTASQSFYLPYYEQHLMLRLLPFHI